MSHTKGKWFWRGKSLRTRQQSDRDWKGTLVFHSLKSEEETRANLNLIAAAPEMLEVLKYTLDYLRENMQLEGLGMYEHLIAKAEGKQTRRK